MQTQSPPSDLAKRLERAETIWRARSRVERGDTVLAEPLLERLFAESRGGTGETSLVIAEGLLRCRLARGEQVGAVIPALEVARLRRANVSTTSYANLAPVLDETTLLVPTLPPILPAGPALTRLQGELDAAVKAPGDPIIRALAAGYRASLVLEPGSVPSPGGPIPSLEVGDAKAVRDHPGAALLRALLAANAPDARGASGTDEPNGLGAPAELAARRTAGRQKLATLELDPGTTPWAESWRRFFLGTSLLHEAEREERRRGVVDLLHVTALDATQQPWLSGVALAVASDVMAADGAAAAAATLRREFELLHPHHALRPAAKPPAGQVAKPPAGQVAKPPAGAPTRGATP